jgi:hypothetical protein
MKAIDPRDKERVRRALRAISRKPCHGVGTRGCYPEEKLDLVTRVLIVRRYGKSLEIPVTLQRCAMRAFLEALLVEPRIQPWASLSSYRSCEVQRFLYQRYRVGGSLAAPPGRSWHNVGLAFDLYPRMSGTYASSDRTALIRAGWRPLGGVDPPHFEFRHQP